ncbi:hypothetical protein [Pseudomonas veronii]|uniref:hypothetical protein n=1 Tax=Pseudomonas veronii TaxID=76761 RepID=UPI0023DF6BC3|nr:hypothetical protein [Pseudomonas veronii]MDF3239295.1 hypothetical protein [Pseudomonas veronii]
MNAIKLLFLLIIFPLLLAGVGTWQLQRATEGAQVPDQAQAYVNVLIGVVALAGTQWAGRRAQQSREQLLQVFSLGSRLLPYVLVSQVVAMARCCCRWRSCASTTRGSNPMKA